MAIHYQGKITPSDVRKAIFRNYSRVRFWISYFLLGLVIVWIIYSIIKFPYSGSEILFWAAVLFVAAMDLWLPFLYARRTNRKGSFYMNPIQGIADENGITLENGELKLESVWSKFTRYKIFDKMVLLYRGKKGLNIFTSALFASEEDWKNFKNLVQAKIH
jgi:YcxB-like protein